MTEQQRLENCERAKQWYQGNKERKKAYDKEYNALNREKKSKQSSDWDKANKEKSLSIKRKSYRKHRKKVFANAAMRRARKLQATPKWLTAEHKKQMADFYANRPDGYHVDHISPLKGKNSCGLHVPWNLQYLPAKENLSKGNKE